jgi:hypothetical protein
VALFVTSWYITLSTESENQKTDKSPRAAVFICKKIELLIGNMPLFITGYIIYVLSFVPFLIAWISALVNLARQQRWLWFVLMFIFSGICLIVYLFAGPEVPSVAKSQQVQLSNQLSQSQENHSL